MKAVPFCVGLLALAQGLCAQEMDFSEWPYTEAIEMEAPLHEQWPSPPADSLILDKVGTPEGWFTVLKGDSVWLAKPHKGGTWLAWSLGGYYGGGFCAYTWELLPQGGHDFWSWTSCEAFSHTRYNEQDAWKLLNRQYWLLKGKPKLMLNASETHLIDYSWLDEDTGERKQYQESLFIWNEIGPKKWRSHSIHQIGDTVKGSWVVTRIRSSDGWSEGQVRTVASPGSGEGEQNEFPAQSQPSCKWWFESEMWIPKN